MSTITGLISGGGGCLSEQPDSKCITTLGVWTGTPTEYNAIAVKDPYTLYFVSNGITNFPITGFTATQSSTGSIGTGTSVTYTVTSVTDPDSTVFEYKFWIVSATSITPSDFTTGSDFVGTSEATASWTSSNLAVLNSSVNGAECTLAVKVRDAEGNESTTFTFNSVSYAIFVTLTFNYSFSGNVFCQCGCSSVYSVQAGSTRDIGGEVDPDQAPYQSISRVSGDATAEVLICNSYSDGWGYRITAGTQDSTFNVTVIGP